MLKQAKTYLGNVKVVWTNGENVDAAPRDGATCTATSTSTSSRTEEVDLPF